MEISTIVAICAPLLNCFQQIPQLQHTIQTKRVDDLSFESLIIGLISTLMWFLHGYFINDISIRASCVFSLGVSIPLLYLYIKYKKEKNEHV